MEEDNSCGCENLPDKKDNSRWWTGRRIFRCAVVLTLLTFPTGQCLEETAHSNNPIIFYMAEVNLTYIDPIKQKVVHETSEGKYGAKSLVEERSGLAVHVRNKQNKTHGCDDYGIKLPKEKWIALVERGNCYFTEKIKMATKKYNASAVVIYNNEDEGTTIMKHTVEDQVSIFVSQKTGRKLAELADKGVRVMITISPGEKQATNDLGTHNTISKTSVLFVSISFIVLMIISLAWLVFYYIQRFRYAHAKERLARRLASAAKKAIAKIPQKTVKNGDRELESDFDQCAVCIEGYRPHDVIRILPCKHVYHKSCVDPWLLDQRSCPMCKLDILRAYGMQVFGSQESVHQDPESGNIVVAVDDHEPSSTTDDQATADTEVKVLLLPHTCLHFHPSHDASSPDSAAGTSSQDACHSPSCSHSVRHSPSADRLSRASSSTTHDMEMQALMSPRHDDDEEEEEDEGFDERHRCALQSGSRKGSDAAVDLGAGAMQLEVRVPGTGEAAAEQETTTAEAKDC
ncbi:RING finger protein 150-like [Babylonia areolata]|uniref:RING finger protein 150-like n=1 Tax=Babylonia areolata TaxID=304850 RepID=UPI003FD53C0A